MKQETVVAVVFAAFAVVGVGAAATGLVPTSGTVAVADGDAPTVHVTGGPDIRLDDGLGPQQNRTTIETGTATIAVTGADAGSVQVDQMQGPTTNLSKIDTSGEEMIINPGDKPRAIINGSITSLTFRNGTLDDGTADFSYSSDSQATVEVGGLEAGAGAGAIKKSSGELIETAVVDADGRVRFDELPSGSADILIQRSPQTLTIRPESSPNEKIGSVDVEIRFYVQDENAATDVITRSTTNGEIDMTGLPDNESFIVQAAADGWGDRTIFVDNLFEQQNIYLLNESTTTVTKVFKYSDFSGEFPQDSTVLAIQRPINGQFVTVQGDVIGATGEYRATMQQGERHRIVLLNRRTGESRVQGNFRPLTSSTQEIQIYSRNDISIVSAGPILQFSPSTGAVRAAETTFETKIRNRDSPVKSATVTLYERNGSQLTQIMSNTTNGPGQVTQNANLTGSGSNTAVIEVKYELEDGTTSTRFENYSIRKQFGNANSLLSTLGGFGNLLPEQGFNAFQLVSAVFSSILFAAGAASRVRLSSEGFGVVFVAGLIGWSIIGWVGYGLVFAAGVTLGALVFLRRGI